MEKTKIHTFKDLNAWKEAHQLVLVVYRTTKRFPKDEIFAMVSQLRRAAVSITSNIAEGFSRTSFKEKAQFYAVAQGSLTEVESQILVARDLGYFGATEAVRLESDILKVHKILNGLLKSTKSRIDN
jgi:four helix bundle protein